VLIAVHPVRRPNSLAERKSRDFGRKEEGILATKRQYHMVITCSQCRVGRASISGSCCAALVRGCIGRSACTSPECDQPIWTRGEPTN